jgi:hypothetical protein
MFFLNSFFDATGALDQRVRGLEHGLGRPHSSLKQMEGYGFIPQTDDSNVATRLEPQLVYQQMVAPMAMQFISLTPAQLPKAPSQSTQPEVPAGGQVKAGDLTVQLSTADPKGAPVLRATGEAQGVAKANAAAVETPHDPALVDAEATIAEAAAIAAKAAADKA